MGIVKLYIAFIFCFVLTVGSAQDKLPETPQPVKKQAELGATLFIVNAMNEYDNFGIPRVEYINGLFYRHSFKRFGIRALLGYSRNNSYLTTLFPFNDPYADVLGIYVKMDKHDIKYNIGFQYYLTRKKQWLYSFLDIGYRSIKASGVSLFNNGSVENYDIKSKISGIDGNIGLGFKLTLFKSICLSPEIGVYVYNAYTKNTYSKTNTNFTTKENTFLLEAMAKLHLTVKI